MNSDLKFRIWDTKYKNFLEYSPNVTYNGYCWWNCKEEFFVSEGSWQALFFDNLRESSQYIIQQYTGLEDCKLKKIYDGDVLKIPDGENRNGIHIPYCHVWYNEGCWVVSYNHKYSETSELLRSVYYKYEVVSNIFEHDILCEK